MSLDIPPKEVDTVNAIKTNLQHHVDRISRIGSANSAYMENYQKAFDLLTRLGKLDINVGTLHVTKIGKLMTKYEHDLPKELSDIATENNRKWKILLSEYRDVFKRKKYIKINEVPVKEEPLSQDSYNDLLASQETCTDAEDSYNMLLESSQDIDISNPETLTEDALLTSTPLNQITESNTIDSPSRGFLADMREVVGNLTQSLSSVEVECNRLRTMFEYINDKLNDYENNLSQHASLSTSSNSKNIDVRGSFEKTGRAVMPCLFSPSPTRDSTKSSPDAIQPTSTTSTLSLTQISRPIPGSLDQTKKTNNSEDRHKKSKVISDGHTSSNKKLGEKPSKAHAGLSTKQHKSNYATSKNVVSCTVTKSNACLNGISFNHPVTSTSNVLTAADTNYSEDINPCSSSIDDDADTLPYPTTHIKQEQPNLDNSNNIEFFCHPKDNHRDTDGNRNSSRKSSNNVTESTSMQEDGTSFRKLKRKSSEKDGIPSKVLNSKETRDIHDRITKISHKLKRKSIDGKERDVRNTANEIPSEVTVPKSKAKSTVFEVDGDGFTVPNVVNQNELHVPEDTVILKGAPVLGEDVGVNLDEVELEDFLTYSQVVNNMSDEIDDVEKEYLLANKRNRTSWNNSCKIKEGVKYSPLLVKSKGRMKAAHKESVGKEVVYNMLNKNK